jgi:hypothetical protein
MAFAFLVRNIDNQIRKITTIAEVGDGSSHSHQPVTIPSGVLNLESVFQVPYPKGNGPEGVGTLRTLFFPGRFARSRFAQSGDNDTPSGVGHGRVVYVG